MRATSVRAPTPSSTATLSSRRRHVESVPQRIKLFKREDIPVSMGLVIDNSGSMREKRAKVEAAALALVKDSNPQDEVFIGFSIRDLPRLRKLYGKGRWRKRKGFADVCLFTKPRFPRLP